MSKGDSGGVVYTDDGALAGLQSGGSDKLQKHNLVFHTSVNPNIFKVD